MANSSTPKEAGKHGWSASCAPGGGSYSYNTFSIGVFQWIPRSRDGVKRGPVLVRVRGSSASAQKMFDRANEIAEQLNAGTYNGKKTVVVAG